MSFHRLTIAAVALAAAGVVHDASAQTFKDKSTVEITKKKGAKGELAPLVRITSPLSDGNVGRGRGFVGNGSPLGAAFAINLEIFTRDATGVLVEEETQAPTDPGIRNVDALGGVNPEFPGLFVFINKDLITPDGGKIKANTNLGPLFNIAGTDDTPGPGVTVWAGWHVLESFKSGVDSFKLTAAVIDEDGRIGFDQITCNVQDGISGNDLTPDPSTYPLGTADNPETANGPLVEIVAPRTPTAIALGVQNVAPLFNVDASLHFIQVDVLDIHNAGIAVDEIGQTVTVPEFGLGAIPDPTQLAAGGSNRNFPGLFFSFDVPVRAANGLVVPAGGNLAAVFNIVGSEIDPATQAVRVVADWVVGGSLILDDPDKEFVTFTAKVTDNTARTTSAKRTFGISEVLGGRFLTPDPRANDDDDDDDDDDCDDDHDDDDDEDDDD